MHHTILANAVLKEVQTAFSDMGRQMAEYLPKIAISLAIFIVGLIAAKIIRGFLTKTFQTIRLNELIDKAGIGDLFRKIGLTSGPAVFLPKLVYWIILLMVIKVAAQSAGISEVTAMVESIIAFLPKVFMAAVIMLVGFMVSDLIQAAVYRALDAKDLSYAQTLARIVSAFVFILFLTVALPQLGIQTELLNASVKIILAGISLALALALGLGLKTPAQNVISGVYARDLYQSGTVVEMDGEEAKVVAVGPLTAKLQAADGTFLIVPNSTLVNTTIKGRSAS